MFHAARAALLTTGAPVDPNIIRTHKGLIGAFSQYVVKNNPDLSAMGRILNATQEGRIEADYKVSFFNPETARAIVEKAENFVATIKNLQLDSQPEAPKQESDRSTFDPF